MFEHRSAPLLPTTAFLSRQLRFAGISAGIVAASLALGSGGYHVFGGLSWLDAVLNAAMILTGMGPVDRMQTPAAKLFATAFALFSGVAFVTTTAVLFAPLAHRFFHRLHQDVDDDDPGRDAGRA